MRGVSTYWGGIAFDQYIGSKESQLKRENKVPKKQSKWNIQFEADFGA